jgi:hypothetical protein
MRLFFFLFVLSQFSVVFVVAQNCDGRRRGAERRRRRK